MDRVGESPRRNKPAQKLDVGDYPALDSFEGFLDFGGIELLADRPQRLCFQARQAHFPVWCIVGLLELDQVCVVAFNAGFGQSPDQIREWKAVRDGLLARFVNDFSIHGSLCRLSVQRIDAARLASAPSCASSGKFSEESLGSRTLATKFLNSSILCGQEAAELARAGIELSFLIIPLNFFKSFTLTWWQGGLFKLSMVALGLALGVTWPGLFATWLPMLWVVFALAAGYITWVWLRQ